MNQNKKNSFETCRFDFGIGALLGAIESMTPACVIEGELKKRGYRPRKTEADVEALAAAVEKRERRAARNQRNAQRMAEGEARAKGKVTS